MAAAMSPGGTNGNPRLTGRELEILEMTTRGLTNEEMAHSLQLSIHGVKYHLASIYKKLGVSNRTEAAVRFLAARDVSQGRTEPTAP